MKNPLNLYPLLITIFVFAACQNKPDASRFRNGTFRSKVSEGGIIKRTGNTQTETIKGLPEATFDVKWLDSLTYVLAPTKETAEMLKTTVTSTVTVKITRTTDSSYFCDVTSNFAKDVMHAEYVKIK